MRKSSVLLLAALLLSPAGQLRAAQGLTTIRVAGPANEGYKDVYYAVQSGLFRKFGLDVQPTIVNGGAAALAGLVGGSFEVAYSNLVPVLQGHLHGVAFVVISPSTMYESAKSQNAMLVAKDSPLRNGRDLNDKTIGTQSLQDLNSVAMRAWIDKNGGDSRTIRLLEVPSSAAVSALTEHRVDAMALSEPLLGEALSTGKVRVLAQPQDAIARRFQAQAFIAMSGFVERHPNEMSRFARAMHESAIYNNTHLADTVQLIASFTGVPPDVIAHSVRSVDALYADPRNIQPLIDAAARYGLISSTFPATDIISPAAVRMP
jgi:NitT/TauT family transport system substrate-binding protein